MSDLKTIFHVGYLDLPGQAPIFKRLGNYAEALSGAEHASQMGLNAALITIYFTNKPNSATRITLVISAISWREIDESHTEVIANAVADWILKEVAPGPSPDVHFKLNKEYLN